MDSLHLFLCGLDASMHGHGEWAKRHSVIVAAGRLCGGLVECSDFYANWHEWEERDSYDYALATSTNGAQSIVSLVEIDAFSRALLQPAFVAFSGVDGTPEFVLPGTGASVRNVVDLASIQILAAAALANGVVVSASWPWTDISESLLPKRASN